MSDYKSLAKIVSKQRLKNVDEDLVDTTTTTDGGAPLSGQGYFQKQQMIESRIEKLRDLEAQVKTDTVCTKKNCPVSLDQRTTQERYRNDPPSGVPIPERASKETRERIERFRSVTRQ